MDYSKTEPITIGTGKVEEGQQVWWQPADFFRFTDQEQVSIYLGIASCTLQGCGLVHHFWARLSPNTG
jgi:hypothetical protein